MGKRPQKPNPKRERELKQVSVWDGLELAIEKAAYYAHGEYIAELEVPDRVTARPNGKGHVGLEGTRPSEFDNWIVGIHKIGR